MASAALAALATGHVTAAAALCENGNQTIGLGSPDKGGPGTFFSLASTNNCVRYQGQDAGDTAILVSSFNDLIRFANGAKSDSVTAVSLTNSFIKFSEGASNDTLQGASNDTLQVASGDNNSVTFLPGVSNDFIDVVGTGLTVFIATSNQGTVLTPIIITASGTY
jgi:hypothetical protein